MLWFCNIFKHKIRERPWPQKSEWHHLSSCSAACWLNVSTVTAVLQINTTSKISQLLGFNVQQTPKSLTKLNAENTQMPWWSALLQNESNSWILWRRDSLAPPWLFVLHPWRDDLLWYLKSIISVWLLYNWWTWIMSISQLDTESSKTFWI